MEMTTTTDYRKDRPRSRMRAVLRKTSFKAGAVVLAGGAAAAFLVGPAGAAPAHASGCAYTYNFDYIQGQVDNCPGGGLSAWAWLYVPNAGNAATGILTYGNMYITYRNPSGQTQSYDLGSNDGYSATHDFYGGDVITQVSFCETLVYGLPPIYPFYRCSNTVNVP